MKLEILHLQTVFLIFFFPFFPRPLPRSVSREKIENKDGTNDSLRNSPTRMPDTAPNDRTCALPVKDETVVAHDKADEEPVSYEQQDGDADLP